MDVARLLQPDALKFLWNFKWLYRPSQLCLYIALILLTAYHNGGIQLISMLNLLGQYTIINMVFNVVYFVLAIVLEMLKYKNQRTTLSLMIFTSCMANAVCYWGISYYIPYAFDTGLSGLPYWWSTAVHTWPVFGIFVDLLCHKPSQPDFKAAFIVILAVIFVYGIFLDVNATNGYYVYAILGNLQRNDRLLFYLIILGIVFICFAIACSITFVLYQLSKDKHRDAPSETKTDCCGGTSGLPQCQHHVPGNNKCNVCCSKTSGTPSANCQCCPTNTNQPLANYWPNTNVHNVGQSPPANQQVQPSAPVLVDINFLEEAKKLASSSTGKPLDASPLNSSYNQSQHNASIVGKPIKIVFSG